MTGDIAPKTLCEIDGIFEVIQSAKRVAKQ